MKALVTGASGGIGRDMARMLSAMGYDLIAVARSRDKLEALKQELNTEVQVLPLDLSRERACFDLYNQVKDQNIDVLINNAGYGMYGRFYDTDLEQELNMLRLNIQAVHILTKLFLRDFKKIGTRVLSYRSYCDSLKLFRLVRKIERILPIQ